MLRRIRVITFQGMLCSTAFALASGTAAIAMDPALFQSLAIVLAGPQSS